MANNYDTVTTGNIPDEFKPYIKSALSAGESAYGGGLLSQVAGASNLQNKAWGSGISGLESTVAGNKETLEQQRARLQQMAMTGGANELQDALKLDVGMGNAAIGNQYGASGTLGSYRQNLASATSEDAAKAKFAQQVITNKSAAEKALVDNASGMSSDQSNLVKTLESSGGQQRNVEQQGLDSAWQGLQRYASTIFGNPARQSTQVVQNSNFGSGGK